MTPERREAYLGKKYKKLQPQNNYSTCSKKQSIKSAVSLSCMMWLIFIFIFAGLKYDTITFFPLRSLIINQISSFREPETGKEQSHRY